MAERMAGDLRDLLLEKSIESLMAEGLDFTQAFTAAVMILPHDREAPGMDRKEAIEIARRLSDG